MKYLKNRSSKKNPKIRDRAILYVIAVSFLGLIAIGYQIELGKMFNVARAEVSVPRQEKLSPREEICKATGGENCDVLYNLMMHESGGKKYAVNKNKDGSIDYSWFQINTIHIKGLGKKGTVDMECVYNLSCIAQWTNTQIKAGNGHMWVAWDYL